MRLVRRILLVVLLLAAGVGAWLLVRVGPRAMLGGLEQWCGEQLLAIANDHLGPKLEWKRIAWVPPRSVEITGLTMTAGAVTIIEAQGVRIDFARVPRRGEPIVIEAASFSQPVVRLVETADGSLAGFGGFVKSGAGTARPDGGSTKLSDVLAIKKIAIAGGGLEYRTPDRPPMLLRPLDFQLDHASATTGAAPGWYAFAAALDLEPVAKLSVQCRLNLDSLALDFEKLVLDTELSPGDYGVFPPQIQQYLEDHEIRGRLVARAMGTVNASDFAATSVMYEIDLDDASIAFGEYVLPVQSVRAQGGLKEARLEVTSAAIAAFGGTIDVTGWLDLHGERLWHAQGQGRELHLAQALREPGDDPRISGIGAFTVAAGGSMSDLAGTLDGSGDIRVATGRLPAVQLFGNLLNLQNARGHDRASTKFHLKPRSVEFIDAFACGTAIGIRGGGDLFYDGRLDMQVRAGVVERLDGVLAGVGKLFSTLTGGLVSYRVQGTVQAPKVSVVTLGIGGRPADSDGAAAP